MTSPLTPLVLWAGPINESQAREATISSDARRHFFVCTGDGSSPPRCSDLATHKNGRILPSLLSRIGLTEESVGDIYLGAFSAGGHLWKRLLDVDADRSRISGVMLHDAAYETGAPKDPKFVEGYVKYGLDALNDPTKFMLMTASTSPNVPKAGQVYQSGADTMRATIEEIERRSGRRLAEGGSLPAGVPVASRLWSNGKNIWLAQYNDIGHMGLAGNASTYWNQLLKPWISSSKSDSALSGAVLRSAVSVLAGVGVGYIGASYYQRARR